MLKINLLILTLLVVIQHTRQCEFNMGHNSNKDCGKPIFGLPQLQTIPYEGDPDNAHPIKNIFRQKRKKLARPSKDKAMVVPVLLMSNSVFHELSSGIFNFNDIKSFKIGQSHSDKDRYRKLRHNVHIPGDDHEKYNDYTFLFKKDQRQPYLPKPELIKKKNYGLRIILG